MSDDADVPHVDVDREFSKATQMLSDAKTAAEVDISKATVVNRLYYACFHAAQGALYANGHTPQSHGAVQTLLGRELIQRGDAPRHVGRFFNDMQTYRRRVDYGTGGVERDADALIQETTDFLETMHQLADGYE